MRRAWLILAALAVMLLVVVVVVTRSHDERPRVLVIAVDGADWDVLEPLLEAGRMPHLARLREGGTSGPLRTLDDIALSPVIWTSVVTGKPPREHGITWFLVDTPEGKRVPVRSHNRKVKALWNILAEQGKAPGVVGWWASAPAEDVGAGVIASDALGYHGFGRGGEGLPDAQKVHPSDLHEDLSLLVPPVAQIDYSFARRFFDLSADEFYAQAFTGSGGRRVDVESPIQLFQEYASTTLGYTAISQHLLERFDLDLFLVYYESTDSLSHLFMKYAPPKQE